MNKKKFGNRLKQLRLEQGLTQTDVAEYLKRHTPGSRDVGRSNISKYEHGNNFPQHFYTIETLANLFNVNYKYLTGEIDQREGNMPLSCHYVPVLGTIAAGLPIFAQEDVVYQECINVSHDVTFCLEVKGDSMIGARINDGDIVYIRQQPSVENGEIAVVMVGEDDATLKRIYRFRDYAILKAENDKYKEIIINKTDIKKLKILGKAVFFKSKVK